MIVRATVLLVRCVIIATGWSNMGRRKPATSVTPDIIAKRFQIELAEFVL